MVRHSRDYITDISVKPKHIYKDFERNEYEVLVPLFLLFKCAYICLLCTSWWHDCVIDAYSSTKNLDFVNKQATVNY